jgi:hypothetical protein
MTTKTEQTILNIENTENTAVNTENTAVNIELIDLKIISIDILSKNEKIVTAAKNSNSNVLVTAKQLSKKHSELSFLNELALIAIGKNRNNSIIQALIPTIYRDNENIIICLPDTNLSEIQSDFKVIECQLNNPSYAIIQHNEYPIKLKIGIALTNEARNLIDDNYEVDGVIETKLDIDYLKDKPRLELSLKTLPLKTKFTVLNSDKRTNQYNTMMIDCQDSKGKIYSNIIVNSDLEKMIENFGDKTVFSIDKIDEIDNFKFEDKLNRKTGKREKTKVLSGKITKITINCDNLNYSNI